MPHADVDWYVHARRALARAKVLMVLPVRSQRKYVCNGTFWGSFFPLGKIYQFIANTNPLPIPIECMCTQSSLHTCGCKHVWV